MDGEMYGGQLCHLWGKLPSGFHAQMCPLWLRRIGSPLSAVEEDVLRRIPSVLHWVRCLDGEDNAVHGTVDLHKPVLLPVPHFLLLGRSTHSVLR